MTKTMGPRMIVLSVAFMLIMAEAQVRPGQLERGGEWLSWSEGERNTYVVGLITGYRVASLRACNAADQLFEIGQPHRLGDQQHPSEMPSARCLARVDSYSKCESGTTNCSAYAKTITEFYTKHPEYQDLPFPELMEFLSDGKSNTADQLYEVAQHGQVRPPR